MLTLTASGLRKKIKVAPFVVHFWSPWCKPCIDFATTFEEIEARHPNVEFGSMNTEENDEFCANQGVIAMPTVILYKGGKQFRKFVGLPDKDALEKAIKELDT